MPDDSFVATVIVPCFSYSRQPRRRGRSIKRPPCKAGVTDEPRPEAVAYWMGLQNRIRKLVRHARNRACAGHRVLRPTKDAGHPRCSPVPPQVGLKPQQHRGLLGSHRGSPFWKGVIDGATATDIGPYRPTPADCPSAVKLEMRHEIAEPSAFRRRRGHRGGPGRRDGSGRGRGRRTGTLRDECVLRHDHTLAHLEPTDRRPGRG